MGVSTPWNIGIKLYCNQFTLVYWFIGSNSYWLLGHLVNWFIGIWVNLPAAGQSGFPAGWTTDFCSCLSVPVQSHFSPQLRQELQSANHLMTWSLGLLVTCFDWCLDQLATWNIGNDDELIDWYLVLLHYWWIGCLANSFIDELTTWFIGSNRPIRIGSLITWNQ